MIMNELQTMPY